ncbi:MAG: 30S ribosomal protein S27ae [Thaumarchaeota archaeon]|nr:30S ribosomal protein S27ae [Nitrososphaerota archaeon]
MSAKDSKSAPAKDSKTAPAKDAKTAPTKDPKAAAAPTPAPAAVAAAPTEAEAAPKPRKERKEKKPKVNIQVWKLYKVAEDGATLQRLRKECPRCGHGYFMAEHKDRQSCGHCGFTNFKPKS